MIRYVYETQNRPVVSSLLGRDVTRSRSSAISGRSVGGFVIPVAGSLHPVARTAEQLDVVRGVGTVLAERDYVIKVQMFPVPYHRVIIGDPALSAASFVPGPYLLFYLFRDRDADTLFTCERFHLRISGWFRRWRFGIRRPPGLRGVLRW
jgi:hypothetical protein